MTLDPRLLRPFVVLAEELHFGRAAQRLHVTQPALSQQVKRLERQLGVELFTRTRVSVELTEAGDAVLDPARAAVAATDEAELIAAELAGAERGRLRIGISPGSHELTRRVLAELRERRPRLTLEAKQDNSGVLCADVAAGRLDVAIAFEPEHVDGTVREEISREPAVVAVAAGHPLAGRDRVALAELAAEDFALVDVAGGRGYNRAIVHHCRAAGFEPRLDGDPHGPMAWENRGPHPRRRRAYNARLSRLDRAGNRARRPRSTTRVRDRARHSRSSTAAPRRTGIPPRVAGDLNSPLRSAPVRYGLAAFSLGQTRWRTSPR